MSSRASSAEARASEPALRGLVPPCREEHVWRRPLPQVLKEFVMDPIGASQTWRWYGYENSWVLIDGVAIQSVSGGGHWGGGMFISARDQILPLPAPEREIPEARLAHSSLSHGCAWR